MSISDNWEARAQQLERAKKNLERENEELERENKELKRFQRLYEELKRFHLPALLEVKAEDFKLKRVGSDYSHTKAGHQNASSVLNKQFCLHDYMN